MKCIKCVYHWAEPEDEYARCHFDSESPFPAPCEEEEEYYEEPEEEIVDNRVEYIVFGVGKYSDANPPMDEIVLAEDYTSARKIFEQRHPGYRSTSAYKLNK
jgi:hypothetical protein